MCADRHKIKIKPKGEALKMLRSLALSALRFFEIRPFETLSTKENVDSDTITQLLDVSAFYTLMGRPIPRTRDGILHDFTEYEFIKRLDNGNYRITNMGALLFAKDFSKFDFLQKEELEKIDESPNYMTVPAALKELEKIEMIRGLDRIYRLDHAVTKTQKTILKAFGMDASYIKSRAERIGDRLKIADEIRG